MPGGRSCAYYTGKHRALLLTPHFSDGAGEMRFIRARGGLAAVGVVDRAADAANEQPLLGVFTAANSVTLPPLGDLEVSARGARPFKGSPASGRAC